MTGTTMIERIDNPQGLVRRRDDYGTQQGVTC
jgi:hypothetical protein